MRKFLLVTLAFVMSAMISQAQNVTGNVKDEQGKSLSGATVALKKIKDSAVAKLSVTNAGGQFSFEGVAAGQYFINATFVGHKPKNSPSFEVNGSGNVTAPEIVLAKASGDLAAVAVTARKPMIEVKADRTILNVEGSVNAVGQDALELLRKSPGVLVDKDDNLSLSGKNGVQVYIDGRPTPLSGKDLSDYLKTLQSSNIEAIEIITNPSAKYDAAGNAGIINIRLKKNKSFGTNGSINAGYNIGTYPKYNGGFSLNHRNSKINAFGNYNYSRSNNANTINLERTLLDTFFKQHGDMNFRNKGSHNFKAGVDYFLNKRSTVGVMVNGNISENTFSNLSKTTISYQPTGETVKLLEANNRTAAERKNATFNVNYRYADTAGRELNIDGDYGFHRIKSDQYQPNVYFDPSGGFLENRIYNMLAPTDIDLYTLKADYEQNLWKGKLGLGAKFSYVDSRNDFERFDVITSGKFLDTLRSNDFNYKENINAGYVNYNRQFKGFMIQAGLRVENTNATGRSTGYRQSGGQMVEYDSSFDRNYTDFFPSAAITFNKKPTNQFTISYSRRIDRPAYQDLNPFEFKLDEYTYQKGNTQLRPQYTNSVALTHVYKYTLTTTLTYSHVKDIFSQLIDTAEKSKSFITKKNLATQDIFSINISYPFTYKWYTVFGNLNAYYSHYKADLGGGNRNIDLDVYALTTYVQNTFRLGKGWTGELTGLYVSPSIWQGTFKSREMWGIDGGLLKTVLKGKGTVKASVSDIFRTMQWGGTSDFSGQQVRAWGRWESRQFKLNFTYRFGSTQVKQARQRKSGLEDENKRVGSQGGGLSGGNN